MVTSVRVALALVGCLSLVGCAAEPLPKQGTPVDETKIDVPDRTADDTSSESDGDTDLPITPVEADDDRAVPTETEDRQAPPQGGDTKPGTNTKPPAGGETPATPSAKTQSCTSTNGDYKALTTITYTVSGTTAKISKMTVKVTNPNERDQNDVDVYVNDKEIFNSGDILKNGQTVEIPGATTLDVKTGTKVKILTNFDRALTDPTADCTIQF